MSSAAQPPSPRDDRGSSLPPSPPSPGGPSTPPPKRHKWYRLKWVGVGLFIFVICFGAMMAGAEYYTARPQFCGTCHIMGPYYESWHNDPHSAPAVSARCVDCHYAPGEQHTIHAKFRGLSQVTSYFSGRYGASRPKAHVNDASCLTSKCHGDGKYEDTPLKMRNVTFVHSKHLSPEGKIAVEKRKEIERLRSKLSGSLGPRLDELDALARPIEAAPERDKRLTAWLADQQLLPYRDDVLAYAEMLHVEVRLRQLAGLKCASCHQFNTALNTHFAVSKTTCYTCHFINEPFNANSGRCLACHEPPTGNVAIHAGDKPGMVTTTGPAGVITMNHATIIANNVNCSSCHSDLIHGTGVVTRRDCQNCHDQAKYLRDFDNLTTAVVEEYHRTHAAEQRARCNDCHQMIEHKLMPVAQPSDAAGLLAPVRQDCQHCHPDHHREQVELLLGRGGFVEGAGAMPNPMTGSRANCQACHTKEGADPKDEAVIKGTLDSCRGCHSMEYEQLFRQWQESIASRLQEGQTLLANVEQRLGPAATQAPGAATQPAMDEAHRLLERARRNIHLVRSANGIHNRNYALMLLDQAVSDLDRAGKLATSRVSG
jgi:nitrate/TMAO reductase-like tetraheme cytochrome c subunit